MKRPLPLGIRHDVLVSHLARYFTHTRMITAAIQLVLGGGRTCDLGAKAHNNLYDFGVSALPE